MFAVQVNKSNDYNVNSTVLLSATDPARGSTQFYLFPVRTGYPSIEFRCTVGHWKLTKMAAYYPRVNFTFASRTFVMIIWRDSRSNQKECRK